MKLIYHILRNIENNSQHIYLINVHLYPGSHAIRFMCLRPVGKYNEFPITDTTGVFFFQLFN